MVSNKSIAELEAENEFLRETLQELQRLGHSSHHGRGATLANMAKEALLSLDERENNNE